jgi:hypothetical protein
MHVRRSTAALTRWWLVPLVAASSLLAALVVLQQRVGAAPGPLPAFRAPGCARPAPDTAAGFQRMFDGLAGSWAGGDQAATVALPHARTLWIFADTVSGHRAPSGGYAPGWSMRHNSFLIEDGGCLRSVQTGLPETADIWYWPVSGLLDGGRLHVFAMRVARTSSGLGFRLTGTALAEYDLTAHGTPTLRGVRALPSAPRAGVDDTLWGQGTLVSGREVYVYGTRGDTAHRAFGRALLVARAPAGAVADTAAWRYFDGVRFVTDPRRARPVVAAPGGVSTSVSALRTDGGVAIVSKQDDAFGNTVAAWTARTPLGPFTMTPLLAAPSDPEHGLLRYAALAHPELTLAGGELLVSVCRNSLDLAEVGRDALLYRPQFAAVRLPAAR